MSQPRQRLVLVDGNSLLHRAYHALPKDFTNSQGQPTGAVYGFASMLLKVIEELKPDFLAVAFDRKGPTFRHAEYVDYKKGRPEMDSELVSQIPLVEKLLTQLAVPFFAVEGYEGEDIVASLNRQAGEKQDNLLTYIVTGDRDLLQLVDKDTIVYAPLRGISETITYDPQTVERSLGIFPSQVPDYKGLRGDASDRIPGVAGVGEKTAAMLLKEFGSLEGIYQNLGKVKPALAKKLAQEAESAALSKRLATIVADAPITLDLKKCRFGTNSRQIVTALQSFGFKSLAGRVSKEPVKEKATKPEESSGQVGLW